MTDFDGTPGAEGAAGRQAAAPPLLRCERVSKVYDDGKVRALRDVDLDIARGDYAAIMGPSGSGKSTLLNVLGALDRPTSGDVRFEGRLFSELDSLDRFRSQELGFVFQSFHLMPVLTALQNVQIPMFEISRPAREKQERARQLLARVGLSPRAGHRPNQLSVGERQRVAVARALANDPRILLADEPTGNLDSQNARGIFDLFDELHAEGMTIILITHDPALGRRASREVRMRDGEIVGDDVR